MTIPTYPHTRTHWSQNGAGMPTFYTHPHAQTHERQNGATYLPPQVCRGLLPYYTLEEKRNHCRGTGNIHGNIVARYDVHESKETSCNFAENINRINRANMCAYVYVCTGCNQTSMQVFQIYLGRIVHGLRLEFLYCIIVEEQIIYH
jgi:hypothetical protein